MNEEWSFEGHFRNGVIGMMLWMPLWSLKTVSWVSCVTLMRVAWHSCVRHDTHECHACHAAQCIKLRMTHRMNISITAMILWMPLWSLKPVSCRTVSCRTMDEVTHDIWMNISMTGTILWCPFGAWRQCHAEYIHICMTGMILWMPLWMAQWMKTLWMAQWMKIELADSVLSAMHCLQAPLCGMTLSVSGWIWHSD